MKATILDTKTGLRKTVDGPSSWQYAENNYACDCNRDLWDAEIGDDGVCGGCKRFIIVAAEMNSTDDYEYTLKELNRGYPPGLLAAFGIL